MKLLALALLLLALAHVVTLRDLFSALDYADRAGKRAYTDIHPHLDRMGEQLKREYQEAQRARR